MSSISLKSFPRKAKGTIFTVSFVKRTDGMPRTMNARLGVTKHLKGGRLPYDPDNYNLMVVYDVRVGGYRMINLEELSTLRLRGIAYDWNSKESRFEAR